MSRRLFYINTKRKPKSRLKDGWKETKTKRWRFQSKDNIRDGFTDMVAIYSPCERGGYYFNKKHHKMLRQIQHKIFFHIPLNEVEEEMIKENPYILELAEWNIKCILKREADKNLETSKLIIEDDRQRESYRDCR